MMYAYFSLQVFRPRTPPEAIDLTSKLLEYTPSARVSPLHACAHSFFNELRESKTRLPMGKELPPLFNFTEKGNHCEEQTKNYYIFTELSHV